MIPEEQMSKGVRKYRNFLEMKPGAPIYQKEFGFYVLERWKGEGYIDDSTNLAELFGYDEPADYKLRGLGWCEAGFSPWFPTSIVEDKGDYELVQDKVGRHLMCFKGRRSGFMPEYVRHPVTDMRSWEENCKWRLDPHTPARYEHLNRIVQEARESVHQGKLICQQVVGGYMYLRSLIGPGDVPYMFYDNPQLIHACMETWLHLADVVIANYQRYVNIDVLAMAEDICYNHGPLISPQMMQEFLFPYYQQLITNIKGRQPDRSHKLHIFVDTDGYAVPVIALYQQLGMNYMIPFEVAAGCDVVAIGQQYPDLRMSGGFDKRILAQGNTAIDKEIARVMPVMQKRGGYIPTCDHGVPEEVSFDSYMHYRKRMLEFS